MTWRRIGVLDGVPARHYRERWERDGAQGFDIDITIGKPLDVTTLKGADIEQTKNYAAFLESTAKRLYAPDAPRREVTECPCCQTPARGAPDAVKIFGVPYAQCITCGHAFVKRQPSAEALDTIFAESSQHASAYVDKAAIEVRQTQVIRPKVDWVFDVFRERFGSLPATALDVGAGGGHFVAELKKRGIEARGIEISETSRSFAKQAFAIDLAKENFLTTPAEPVDLITMWGLLEYTPEPRRFLEAARQRLDSLKGMLVVEVPRFNCAGTAVQGIKLSSVARHLDPTSHVNTFTDTSLMVALSESGLRPVAAWYFGMDAYELLMQIALRLNDASVPERLADFVPALQASLDQGKQCDDIIVAAVPA